MVLLFYVMIAMILRPKVSELNIKTRKLVFSHTGEDGAGGMTRRASEGSIHGGEEMMRVKRCCRHGRDAAAKVGGLRGPCEREETLATMGARHEGPVGGSSALWP